MLSECAKAADEGSMSRKFLIAAALSVAALNPAAANAGSIRSADIKDCKAERAAIGKAAFKDAYRGGLGRCADDRAADRAARRAAKKAKREVGAPAPVVEATAPVADAPVADAPVAASQVAPAAVAAPRGAAGHNKSTPGNGKKKGHFKS
jgi:hypothetical protein